MKYLKSQSFRTTKTYLVLSCLLSLTVSAFANPPQTKELPIYEKPKQRSSTERVVFRSRPQQPSKGALAVVLNFKLADADVMVKGPKGDVVATAKTDIDGQVEFQLRRNFVYEVEVNHPSYRSIPGKTKALGATEVVRIDLTPEFGAVRFRDLPLKTQVYIDNELRGTADDSGSVLVAGLKLGEHDLLIRHPEYNDYIDKITKLEPGITLTFPNLRLLRVARMALVGPPGAIVLIDGEMYGRINPEGNVNLNYELKESTPTEHTISVEQRGYYPWTKKEIFTPAVKTFQAKLEPIITTAGFSDFFDNLSLWSTPGAKSAPSKWKIDGDERNRRAVVRSEQLGLLSGKVYRDFVVNFLLWMDNEKGATWTVRADKEGKNYYMFHIAGPKSTTHIPKHFYTYLVTEGQPPTQVSTPIPVITELNNKDNYSISIVVEGNRITHRITSNETGKTDDLGVFTDADTDREPIHYGTFGFCAPFGEVFAVDDLAVDLELPKPEQAQKTN